MRPRYYWVEQWLDGNVVPVSRVRLLISPAAWRDPTVHAEWLIAGCEVFSVGIFRLGKN